MPKGTGRPVKIHDVEQNSLEWLALRSGIPTASEWDALVSPEFEIRKGQMPQTYLHQKVAEAWLGAPLPGGMTIDMEFGKVLETEAIPWYEFTFSEEVKRVGFVTTDDGRIGCSPDGLIGEGGIEIKCPGADKHVGYLMAGDVPKQYRSQVHGCMLVTGAPWWKFISYRRNFPPLVITVFRDEKIQAVLKTALESFIEQMDAVLARLDNMGVPRPKRSGFVKPTYEPAMADDQGIIP